MGKPTRTGHLCELHARQLADAVTRDDAGATGGNSKTELLREFERRLYALEADAHDAGLSLVADVIGMTALAAAEERNKRAHPASEEQTTEVIAVSESDGTGRSFERQRRKRGH